jgi:hypothetical protein
MDFKIQQFSILAFNDSKPLSSACRYMDMLYDILIYSV